MKKKRMAALGIKYAVLILLGLTLIFPLVYMFFGTFKSNDEIFGSLKLLPETFSLDGYIKGWEGSGQISFGIYLWNSCRLVVPTVILTVISSVITAYGFGRFNFPGKGIWRSRHDFGTEGGGAIGGYGEMLL